MRLTPRGEQGVGVGGNSEEDALRRSQTVDVDPLWTSVHVAPPFVERYRPHCGAPGIKARYWLMAP